jgi:hypothetical protein
MPTPRYVAIANPQGKRWQAYAAALTEFWSARGASPEVEVVPWAAVVPRDGNLDGLPAFDRPALVRLESPGRDFEVTRQLLAAGGRAIGRKSANWSNLVYQKGRIVRPGLLYQGFERVLAGLKNSFVRRPHLIPLSDPLEIVEMFDKNATCQRLSAAGIPCPAILSPLSLATTPEQLFSRIEEACWSTAYVKLNSGSSASAIVVVHLGEDGPWATSAVVRLREGFFSTRRLRYLRGSDLEGVLTFLIGEGVCVQRGIRMAQIDGQNFDLRVVLIHGIPAFTIYRLSNLPMTNLHLGGRRGDPDRCRAAIPTRAWLDAIDHCVDAGKLYQTAVVGVDLVFDSAYLHHYLLEVNAFGDFFPGLVNGQGGGVHATEIEATASKYGLIENATRP